MCETLVEFLGAARGGTMVGVWLTLVLVAPLAVAVLRDAEGKLAALAWTLALLAAVGWGIALTGAPGWILAAAAPVWLGLTLWAFRLPLQPERETAAAGR